MVKHEQDVLVVPVALVAAVVVLSLELLWHFKNINPINTELIQDLASNFLKKKPNMRSYLNNFEYRYHLDEEKNELGSRKAWVFDLRNEFQA